MDKCQSIKCRAGPAELSDGRWLVQHKKHQQQQQRRCCFIQSPRFVPSASRLFIALLLARYFLLFGEQPAEAGIWRGEFSTPQAAGLQVRVLRDSLGMCDGLSM